MGGQAKLLYEDMRALRLQLASTTGKRQRAMLVTRAARRASVTRDAVNHALRRERITKARRARLLQDKKCAHDNQHAHSAVATTAAAAHRNVERDDECDDECADNCDEIRSMHMQHNDDCPMQDINNGNNTQDRDDCASQPLEYRAPHEVNLRRVCSSCGHDALSLLRQNSALTAEVQ